MFTSEFGYKYTDAKFLSICCILQFCLLVGSVHVHNKYHVHNKCH